MSNNHAIGWRRFAELEPRLAVFGADRLMAGPAYLGTIRKTGIPRVHPVTPVISDLGLHVFMEPTSPKGRDLVERPGYALHNGVADNAGSGGEFAIGGFAGLVEDPQAWQAVAEAATYEPAARYILFELRVAEARCIGYGDVELPDTRRWALAPG